VARALAEIRTGLADAARDRIGEHARRGAFDLAAQRLEPCRIPAIVIAGPGEVLGLGVRLSRNLEGAPCVVDQSEAL
jgi:hypothetical protein